MSLWRRRLVLPCLAYFQVSLLCHGVAARRAVCQMFLHQVVSVEALIALWALERPMMN